MKKTKLEKQIMEQIKKDKVKMKPRWWFLVMTMGLKGITLLSILLSAIIFSIAIYLIETQIPFELWNYGDIGVQIFFEGFPYVWLISGLILVGGGVVLLSRVGENYKKATKKLILITSLLVFVFTILLSAIRIYLN